jgi:septum site-determining protein MinD
MTKIFTITSGKGGVGKTTTAINLGAALNKFGHEVIILDANLTTPNVGLHFGAPIVPITLNHVLLDEAELIDAVYEHESGTKVIPSSLSITELHRIDLTKLRGLSKKLKKMADVVIVDSSAGLGEEALSAMDAGDELIIVTNPEIPAVTDALKTAKVIERMGKKVSGVIVTRVRGNKTEMPLSNISELLDLPIMGVIPEDGNIQSALVMKDAIVHTHPKSRSSRAYREIAARIMGNYEYREKTPFWEKVFG